MTPLATLDGYAGNLLIVAQGWRLLATVVAAPASEWRDATAALQALHAALDAKPLAWDAAHDRYTFADGTVLPDVPHPIYQRVIWTPTIAGATATVMLERKSGVAVAVELRIDLRPGTVLPKGKLRFLDDAGHELAAMDIDPLHAPVSSTMGTVQGRELASPQGKPIRAELTLDGVATQRSAPLAP